MEMGNTILCNKLDTVDGMLSSLQMNKLQNWLGKSYLARFAIINRVSRIQKFLLLYGGEDTS